MGLKNLFGSKEELIAVDIGLSTIKVLEFDASSATPQLLNIAAAPLPADVFNNNFIAKTEVVSEKLSVLLEANGIGDQRAVISMPGPSVFTKRISMPKMPRAELSASIQLEAQSFIPHNVNAVKIDYHILGEKGRNHLDLLVVAVKNEIVDSFIECIALAGLEVAVVDVDYFALQNCFELGYPELVSTTTALLDVGARYSSINICKNGQSLFTGDLSIGGKLFTDALVQELGVSAEDAEKIKRGQPLADVDTAGVLEVFDKKVEFAASELNRQLSLFWNASGAEEGIERIMITGGGALVPGLVEEIAEKTGIECELLDPFKGVRVSSAIDRAYLEELKPTMAVSVGMGIRQPGDKIVPDHL